MARPLSFVILAAMRTGSNLLEESLNRVAGVRCWGEAFNPVFIGQPKNADMLGLTLEERNRDPDALLDRIRAAPGLNGFRYFPDHDPRILSQVLADRTCAKVVLSRNPVDSYVSLAIARETGQWKLGDLRRRRSVRVRFDSTAFQAHLDRLTSFRAEVQRALQTSGQAAYYLDYADLDDAEVFSGLLTFLGRDATPAPPVRTILAQNPEPLSEKVTNPREMAAALARIDPFSLGRLPNFEPRRGPQVPAYYVAKDAPLLFMPVASGPTKAVLDWFSALGGSSDGLSQSALRDWMRAHPNHRRFTVLRHPLLRAFDAFTRFLAAGLDEATCKAIARTHKIGPAATAEAFLAFMRFLKANLHAQTPHRTQPHWASQVAVLQGFQSFASPDLVAREETLADDLDGICRHLGLTAPQMAPDPLVASLAAIATDEHAQVAAQAYQRDYLTFGFSLRL